MVHNGLLRLFGFSSFIGGLLIALLQIWYYLDSGSLMATYLDYVGWILLTFGLIGLFLAQYRSAGGIGFISFFLLTIAMFQWLGYKWFQTFVVPDLKRSAPELLDSGLQTVSYGADLSLYFLAASFFLFATISLWKGILSRWGTSLLLIGSALAFNEWIEESVLYSSLIPIAILGCSLSWIGLVLFFKSHRITYDEVSSTDLVLEDKDFHEDKIEKEEIEVKSVQHGT